MQTINATAKKYRQYLLDTRNLEISQNALNIAKKNYENTKELIEAERKPGGTLGTFFALSVFFAFFS